MLPNGSPQREHPTEVRVGAAAMGAFPQALTRLPGESAGVCGGGVGDHAGGQQQFVQHVNHQQQQHGGYVMHGERDVEQGGSPAFNHSDGAGPQGLTDYAGVQMVNGNPMTRILRLQTH